MSESSESSGESRGDDGGEVAPRDPPKVEVVVVDPAAARPGLSSTLKSAFALGLMGAGLFGVLGTLLGRKLVAWSGTPEVLAECKQPVEIGVQKAIDHFLIAQGLALGTGFLLLFVLGFSRLRARARRAGH